MGRCGRQLGQKLTAVGRVAKNLGLPSPQNVVGSASGLWKALWRYEAYRQYIDDAKRNGNYVEGETEGNGEIIADAVGRNNFALLSPVNTMEQMLLPAKGGKGVWKRLLGIRHGRTGRLYEAAQQIQNQQAAKRGYAGWDDLYGILNQEGSARRSFRARRHDNGRRRNRPCWAAVPIRKKAPIQNNAPTLTSGSSDIDAKSMLLRRSTIFPPTWYAVAKLKATLTNQIVSEV